jgi:hypothetical protein
LDCVRDLDASGVAQLALVVGHGSIPVRDKRTRAFNQLAEQSGARTQGLYGWLELARMTESLVQVDPAIDEQTWKRHVADANLDFLLLFGPASFGIALQNSARYGVWTFAHGDLTRFASAAPGFWELYRGEEITAGFLLKQSGTESPGIALKSAYQSTIRRSFGKNVDTICSLMAKWPALVCRNIQDGVADYFSDEPLPRPSQDFEWPNWSQTAAVRLLEARTRAQETLRSRLFSIDWNVGVVKGSPSDFIGTNKRPKAKYLFRTDPYSYVADPFVVTQGQRTFVFCERYDHRTERGFLVQTELVSGKAEPLSGAIEEKHHLSYPQVFEHGGELYCIPESRAVRKVCLYRCVEFPDKWECVQTLIDDFDGADSTLLSHAGKWWLFSTSSELAERGFNSHLYLWYADDVFGPWKPHPRNPVKMDARSARCAGPLFVHDGAVYRPAQDCGGSYGHCIHIARIDVLNERDFRETMVGTIRPPRGRYGSGIHTISAAGGVCVVDARRYVFSPWRVASSLRGVGRRIGRWRMRVFRQPAETVETVAPPSAAPR